MTDTTLSTQNARQTPQTSAARSLLHWTLAIGVAALIVDSAAETFMAGSPVRWWVAGIAAVSLAGASAWTFVRGTRVVRADVLAGAGTYVLLGTLAVTAWLPGGLTRGVHLAGQPTPVVLALATAGAVLLAGWVLYRALQNVQAPKRVLTAARMIGALAIAYAIAALLLAVRAGAPYSQLFHGDSFWQRAPFWLQGAFLGALVITPLAIVARAVHLGVRKRAGAAGGPAALHQITALALSVVIALGGAWFQPQPATGTTAMIMAGTSNESSVARSVAPVSLLAPKRSYEESAAILDQVMDGIAQLRAQIDRTQFDLAALEAQLGPEARDRIAFVQKEIAFEQYAGMLRGAQGTLMSRAGNALDQAVLLATLLGHAGYEARIARGALTESQARALLIQMAAPRPAARPVGNMDAIRTVLLRLGAVTGIDEQQFSRLVRDTLEPAPTESTEMYRAAQADAEFILATLDRERITLGRPDTEAALIREAQDYFWVEYRRNPSDAWLPAHPAFGADGSAPQEIQSTTFFAPAAVPRTLQHWFRVRVVNEQLVSGTLRTYDAMQWWERPAAALTGTPLTYFNVPSGLSRREDLAELPKLFEKTGIFIPTFNNRPPERGVGFDWEGDTYNVKLLAAGQLQAEELGRSMTRGLGRLTDALDALGDEPSAPSQGSVLTAQWIEYSLVAPGGSEKTFRRSILDRIDPAARAAGRFEPDDKSRLQIGQALTQQHTFMLASGRYPDAYVLDRYLERFLSSRASLDAVVDTIRHPDKATPPSKEGPVDTAWLGHLTLFGAFDQGVGAGDINYRPEPTLVVHQQSFGFPEMMRQSVDIIKNTRRSFRMTNETPVASAQSLVRIGAWETHSEQVLPSDPFVSGNAVKQFDTVEVFRQARAASIPIRILRPNDRPTLSGVALPAAATSALARDLAAGYLVIVPASLPPGSDMAGWWRIDPQTGETLGMVADGRGAEMVEYLATLRMVLGIASALQCVDMIGKKNISDSAKGWGLIACTIGHGVSAGTALGTAVLSAAIAGLIAQVAAILLTNLENLDNYFNSK